MKLSIEGTPEEIKNVLQAISGSEEHKIINSLNKIVPWQIVAFSKANKALDQITKIPFAH